VGLLEEAGEYCDPERCRSSGVGGHIRVLLLQLAAEQTPQLSGPCWESLEGLRSCLAARESSCLQLMGSDSEHYRL